MTIAVLLILACFGIAFAFSLSGFFERFSSATLFGVGSVLSAGGFASLYAISKSFRLFLRARNIRRLTLGQTLRFYGLLAFFEAYRQVLPAIFAVPTGALDTFFAVTSLFVARRWVTADGKPRPGFIAWHIAGLGALGISAVLAILTSPTRFGLLQDGRSSQAMTRFPISLVPVFIGPMVLIFHLLALAAVWHTRRARKDPRQTTG